MALWPVWCEPHRDYEVCTMSGGREDTAPFARLVYRRCIGALRFDFVLSYRYDEYDGHCVLELFGQWLGQTACLAIPTRTVQKQTFQIGAVLRRLWRLFVVHDFIVEREQVNGNCILARVVLLYACQKRLGEKEAWYPECTRCAFFVPVLKTTTTTTTSSL